MIKYIYAIILFFFTASLLSQDSYKTITIEDILKLPEEKINIGVASLILAKDFYPDLNIDFFLYSFDYLAQRFNKLFGHS